jgi:ERCC4-related helicase
MSDRRWHPQGRTGRHRDGKVVYLLTEGVEEAKYNKVWVVACSRLVGC